MITEQQYQIAAKELGVTTAHIKAIKDIESSGSGFLPNGTPTILFERHVMYKLVKEIYGQQKADMFVKQLPNVINPVSGGYGKVSEQPSRLQLACTIDRNCGLQSCSWGLFQIMGYHWKSLGYITLQDFVNRMYASEYEQLMAFVRFIKLNSNLVKALQKNDFTAFARGYNGSAYYKNSYDVKLRNAYNKYI